MFLQDILYESLLIKIGVMLFGILGKGRNHQKCSRIPTIIPTRILIGTTDTESSRLMRLLGLGKTRK